MRKLVFKFRRPKLARVAFAIVVAVGIVWLCGVRLYAFHGDSMRPSIAPGDWMLARTGILKPATIMRFDRVMFKLPAGSPSASLGIPWVKRVVGLPHERVSWREGKIFVNGTELTNTYLQSQSNPALQAEVTLGADEYYVVGDNMESSFEDSRSFGPLKRSSITGGVVCVWHRQGNL